CAGALGGCACRSRWPGASRPVTSARCGGRAGTVATTRSARRVTVALSSTACSAGREQAPTMAKARNSNPVLARIFILVPHDCARRTAAARRLNVVGNTLEWKRGSTEEPETRDGPLLHGVRKGVLIVFA